VSQVPGLISRRDGTVKVGREIKSDIVYILKCLDWNNGSQLAVFRSSHAHSPPTFQAAAAMPLPGEVMATALLAA